MARVRFVNVGLVADVPVGSTILDAATAAGAPEASRCGGVCACSTCHVYVESGDERLRKPSRDELDLLALSAREPRPCSRLGCQAVITTDGPITVSISDESFREYLLLYPDDSERVMALWLAHAPAKTS